MPTSSAVSSAKSTTPAAGPAVAASATAASAAVSGAKAPTGPADFMALLAQMLQAPPEEAAELAIEGLTADLEGDGDSLCDTGDGDALDPASLADQVLAMATLIAPVPVVTTPALPASTAPVDEAPVAASGSGQSVLALVAEAVSTEDAGSIATEDGDAAAARSDSGAVSTPVVVSTTTQATATGQITTQVVAQGGSNDIGATDAGGTDHITQRVVHTTVGTNAWANELGTRLTFMAGQGQHSASLRLSPEHLGPLEVRIDMNDDKASVWFGAQHADTRTALNEALPRLRELFAASGMMLTDAGVSQQSPRQESRDNAARLAQSLNGTSASDSSSVTNVTSVTSTSLLDLYA